MQHQRRPSRASALLLTVVRHACESAASTMAKAAYVCEKSPAMIRWLCTVELYLAHLPASRCRGVILCAAGGGRRDTAGGVTDAPDTRGRRRAHDV